MPRSGLRRRALLTGLTALMAVTATAGCAGTGAKEDPNAPVTLTINLFGDFGYKQLYDEYRKTHPNVTIKENVTDYGTHHKNLQAHLVAGAGAADIEAIEIGQVAAFQPQANKFVNFLDHGVDTSQWTDWKWKAAASPDGKQLFGLGTDIGGLALCYRRDLFAAAGLPTDRDKVAELMPTWDAYLTVGKTFLAKSPNRNVKWFDSSGNLYNAIAAQADEGVYDASGALVIDTNPAVKSAFDTAVAAAQAGESAKLGAFSPEWNTGFQKGQFATVTCPSWMTAYIRDQAPDTTGKWDIARIPGTGGGNWGGSYLTVPTQGKHQAAAIELAKWLTAPEQEAWLFKNKGNFPSDQALWSQPEIANYTDPFFNNAPVGAIFSASAKALKPQPLGPHAGDIGNVIGNALVSVEQGTASPQDAWAKTLTEVKNLTS
ncbi:MAG TPA: extracellular solute-binding protein [Micromonosporaceae bacterium]